MVTEQDVIDYLNKSMTEKKTLKEGTHKYLQKLKVLEDNQNTHNDSIRELELQLNNTKETLLKTQGAISLLLELIALEEGLLESQQKEKDS